MEKKKKKKMHVPSMWSKFCDAVCGDGEKKGHRAVSLC
jgi:hypothetical protein